FLSWVLPGRRTEARAIDKRQRSFSATRAAVISRSYHRPRRAPGPGSRAPRPTDDLVVLRVHAARVVATLRLRAGRPATAVRTPKVGGGVPGVRCSCRRMRSESEANMAASCAAIDLGASSCRMFVAGTDGDRVSLREVSRFPTPLVEAG